MSKVLIVSLWVALGILCEVLALIAWEIKDFSGVFVFSLGVLVFAYRVRLELYEN